MTQKFNIGDRVVVSNPEELLEVEAFTGATGAVVTLGELASDFPQADWRLMESIGLDSWELVKQYDAEEPEVEDDTEERVREILSTYPDWFGTGTGHAVEAIMAIIKEKK